MNPTDTKKQAVAEYAKRKHLGVSMMCGYDQGIYSNLVKELQNNFTKGNGDYPSNTEKVYNLLVKYKTTQSNPKTRLLDYSEEVLFENVGGSKGKFNLYKSSGGGGKRKV